MDYDTLLNTLLPELQEGIIVCDHHGKILLFNRAAADLFGPDRPIRQGESLYKLCCRAPVEEAIRLLQYGQKAKERTGPLGSVQFLNSALGAERYFRCRVSFLPSPAAVRKSFVIILEDISAWYAPGNPLLMKIESFRAPLTNLRAAVENLTEYPEMSPVMRSAFENVLVQESLKLTDAFGALADSCHDLLQQQNHLTTMDAQTLFGYVADHLAGRNVSVTVSPGRSILVNVDMYGLLLVLDHLAGRIRQKQKPERLGCEALAGKQFIYFDFIWPGEFIPTVGVKTMLQNKVKHSLGNMTVAAILHTMDGDIWSLQHENSQGRLRLALPIAAKANK